MAPRMRRGLGVRAIIAGSMVALAAASLPSNAGFGDAPIVTSTSVDSGWSNGNLQKSLTQTGSGKFELAARFDKVLTNRSVTVTDNFANVQVAGQLAAAQPGTGIIWLADSPLLTDGRNYTVDFSAEGAEGTAAGGIQKVFRVDTLVPGAPIIFEPTGISLPGMLRDGNIAGTIALGLVSGFTGFADDRLGVNDDPLGTSGVKSIRFTFFDLPIQAFEQALSCLSPDTVTNLACPGNQSIHLVYNADMGCAGVCSQEIDPWEVALAEVDALSCVLCSVEIQTVDLAGNVSFPADPIVFLNA